MDNRQKTAPRWTLPQAAPDRAAGVAKTRPTRYAAGWRILTAAANDCRLISAQSDFSDS